MSSLSRAQAFKSQFRDDVAALMILFLALVLLHITLLRLPYFWDEAGYYIPAAHDLFLHGDLTPVSTPSSGHPPLMMGYLAVCWKLFGYAPLITRLAMLFIAAFGLVQLYRLAEQVAGAAVAMGTTLCFALYPVFFAQSTLTHSDLPATALTLWGLRLTYQSGAKRWTWTLAFALASLAKEIAVLTPLALAFWELASLTIGLVLARRVEPEKPSPPLRTLATSPAALNAAAFLLSTVPLALWFVYHRQHTGYWLGNPEYFRYNVGATLTPLRMVLALMQRLWQVFGYMNLWVLTLLMAAAMLLNPVQDAGGVRSRIAVPVQLGFLSIVVVHLVFHSVVGGAELARYLMPVIPLVILVAVSTLHRRLRQWPLAIIFVCVTFVTAWFVNPPFRFSPEDNLTYSDFVRLHQDAATFIAKTYPNARILTAWPASDELSRPYLGYVSRPVKVVRIENFSLEQVAMAKQNSDYDAVLVFSTKYEPPRRLFTWNFWEKSNERFFDYHHDLGPEQVAQALGGSVVMREAQKGEWVAVVEIPQIRNVELRRVSPPGERHLETSAR